VAPGARKHRVVCRIRVARRADTVCSMMILREPGVVKRRTRPCRRRMASSASRREASRCMVRIRRTCVIRLVTRVAVRRRTHKHVVDVACRASHRRVESS